MKIYVNNVLYSKIKKKSNIKMCKIFEQTLTKDT